MERGYLLIGSITLLLLVFMVAILLVMILYRNRKLEHVKEMERIKENYHKEVLETQVVIQQETMREIGREIHDNIGQRLTLAALYTERLNLDTVNAPIADNLSNIARLIHDSLQDLRNLSQNLVHPADNNTGLDLLLQKEAARVNQAKLYIAHFTTEGKPLLVSMKIKNMILRIVQEFLQNSIRHADGKNIFIHITYEEKNMTLHLSDDGKGFVKEEPSYGNGVGIENMKKRAELIGASLTLESKKGEGTHLNLYLPVTNES
jgi:signal transduction histidine kinase